MMYCIVYCIVALVPRYVLVSIRKCIVAALKKTWSTLFLLLKIYKTMHGKTKHIIFKFSEELAR